MAHLMQTILTSAGYIPEVYRDQPFGAYHLAVVLTGQATVGRMVADIVYKLEERRRVPEELWPAVSEPDEIAGALKTMKIDIRDREDEIVVYFEGIPFTSQVAK